MWERDKFDQEQKKSKYNYFKKYSLKYCGIISNFSSCHNVLTVFVHFMLGIILISVDDFCIHFLFFKQCYNVLCSAKKQPSKWIFRQFKTKSASTRQTDLILYCLPISHGRFQEISVKQYPFRCINRQISFHTCRVGYLFTVSVQYRNDFKKNRYIPFRKLPISIFYEKESNQVLAQIQLRIGKKILFFSFDEWKYY